MKRASRREVDDDLRPEYDLAQLKGGIRGKYYRQATAGTNLVLIEPGVARVFSDMDSVNRALRLLMDAAQAAAHPGRRRSGTRGKGLKRAARERGPSATRRRAI